MWDGVPTLQICRLSVIFGDSGNKLLFFLPVGPLFHFHCGIRKGLMLMYISKFSFSGRCCMIPLYHGSLSPSTQYSLCYFSLFWSPYIRVKIPIISPIPQPISHQILTNFRYKLPREPLCPLLALRPSLFILISPSCDKPPNPLPTPSQPYYRSYTIFSGSISSVETITTGTRWRHASL